MITGLPKGATVHLGDHGARSSVHDESEIILRAFHGVDHIPSDRARQDRLTILSLSCLSHINPVKRSAVFDALNQHQSTNTILFHVA